MQREEYTASKKQTFIRGEFLDLEFFLKMAVRTESGKDLFNSEIFQISSKKFIKDY